MANQSVPPLIDFFKHIKDPRVDRNKDYPLIEVIVITLLAVMAFAEGWEDIEKYGKAKEGWLKKFLPLEHGIPKHDVYRRVFTRLKPEAISSCFMEWVRAIKRKRCRHGPQSPCQDRQTITYSRNLMCNIFAQIYC
jgi:hypothetical protein